MKNKKVKIISLLTCLILLIVLGYSYFSNNANIKVPIENKNKNFTIPELGIEMVYIEPDKKELDKDKDGIKESTPSGIFYPLWISKYEITQEQYEALIKKNPSKFRGASLPIESISWFDAMDFCNKLNKIKFDLHQLPKDYVFRLPTEKEWMFAAVGGKYNQNKLFSGSNSINNVGWYAENAGQKTHQVGQKYPNALGLYDMTGNVEEWCIDSYDNDPIYFQGSPPANISLSKNIIAKGSHIASLERNSKLSERDYHPPFTKNFMLGFRLCFGKKLKINPQLLQQKKIETDKALNQLREVLSKLDQPIAENKLKLEIDTKQESIQKIKTGVDKQIDK